MTTTPIWQSIADTLTAEIAQGLYLPGDKLPTEAQLAARFDVNRHTVRRALAALQEAELVFSRRGSGVFVTQMPTEYPLGRRVRFAQNLEAAGKVPGKRFLSLETRRADAHEADALRLPPGAEVHVGEGISTSDGQPIALFRSVFPAARFPDLLALLDQYGSVTIALRDAGVEDYTRASTRLTARPADGAQARHLRLREGAALIRSRSVNVDDAGRPVEFGTTWFAGDRVTLTLDAG